MNRRDNDLELNNLFKLPFPSGAMPRSSHIDLRFTVDADCSLWNVVFEGFDEEVDLTTFFTAKTPHAQRVLWSFGGILKSKHRGCRVNLGADGIAISKTMSIRDQVLVRDWVELMYCVLEEMAALLEGAENTTAKVTGA